jgi:hypothetical protein
VVVALFVQNMCIAAMYSMPTDVIMRSAFSGLRQFEQSLTSSSKLSLKEVHFISNDAKLAQEMIKAFKQCASTPV